MGHGRREHDETRVALAIEPGKGRLDHPEVIAGEIAQVRGGVLEVLAGEERFETEIGGQARTAFKGPLGHLRETSAIAPSAQDGREGFIRRIDRHGLHEPAVQAGGSAGQHGKLGVRGVRQDRAGVFKQNTAPGKFGERRGLIRRLAAK